MQTQSTKPVRGIMFARADASMPGMIAELNQAFQAFKAAQDERMKDVVTTDKIERINKDISGLQAMIDAANVKIAAAAIGAGGDKPLHDAEYTHAFRAHFRKGDVQAALNKGVDADGGYLAPVEWDRTITDRLVEVSPMRQIATELTISGTSYTKLFNLGGTGSGWVGEEDARPETSTARFGSMEIGTGEIYANPAATQTMLDDAVIDLEAWLGNEVQTEFSEQEGAAFVAGNGVNKPFGFLSFAEGGIAANRNPLGAIKVSTSTGLTSVTEDELLDLIYALPGAYTGGARFVMNRTSIGKVRKLRDADGRQLWQPATIAGEPSTLLGYPITEMPDMPDLAASATGIAFGNFQRGYLVVDRTGVRVLRDPYTNKPKVLFYTTKRVGGSVVDPRAIKVLRQRAA